MTFNKHLANQIRHDFDNITGKIITRKEKKNIFHVSIVRGLKIKFTYIENTHNLSKAL